MVETQQAQQQAAINVVESLELVGLQRLNPFELQGREALSSHCSSRAHNSCHATLDSVDKFPKRWDMLCRSDACFAW